MAHATRHTRASSVLRVGAPSPRLLLLLLVAQRLQWTACQEFPGGGIGVPCVEVENLGVQYIQRGNRCQIVDNTPVGAPGSDADPRRHDDDPSTVHVTDLAPGEVLQGGPPTVPADGPWTLGGNYKYGPVKLKVPSIKVDGGQFTPSQFKPGEFTLKVRPGSIQFPSVTLPKLSKAGAGPHGKIPALNIEPLEVHPGSFTPFKIRGAGYEKGEYTRGSYTAPQISLDPKDVVLDFEVNKNSFFWPIYRADPKRNNDGKFDDWFGALGSY